MSLLLLFLPRGGTVTPTPATLPTTRFPLAPQNPLRLGDIARAIRIIQTAQDETLPVWTSQPATPKPGQVILLNSGGSLTLQVYDHVASVWRTAPWV